MFAEPGHICVFCRLAPENGMAEVISAAAIKGKEVDNAKDDLERSHSLRWLLFFKNDFSSASSLINQGVYMRK